MNRIIIRDKKTKEIIEIKDVDANDYYLITRKYKEYIVEHEMKKDFKINDYSVAWLLPSYYNENTAELKEICECLYNNCKGIKKIGIYDLNNKEKLQLSASHINAPEYYYVLLNINSDLTNIENELKLFIRDWKEYYKNE